MFTILIFLGSHQYGSLRITFRHRIQNLSDGRIVHLRTKCHHSCKYLRYLSVGHLTISIFLSSSLLLENTIFAITVIFFAQHNTEIFVSIDGALESTSHFLALFLSKSLAKLDNPGKNEQIDQKEGQLKAGKEDLACYE